ncbi:MAG: EamA family transporter, partial [Hyphomonadaceae bacterium]
GALAMAVGGVAMKRMNPIPIFQMQAWVAFVSIPLPLIGSLLLEDNQAQAAWEMGWVFWAVLGFSVFVVSVFGHSLYYKLVQRYEVTLLTPLTLMTPIWSLIFAALILHERLDARLALGTIVVLAGVALVSVPRNLRLPQISALWRPPGD